MIIKYVRGYGTHGQVVHTVHYSECVPIPRKDETVILDGQPREVRFIQYNLDTKEVKVQLS